MPRGASSVCHTKPCGIVTHHPLDMQEKCYGSTFGFHPNSVGSTPISRTNATVAQQRRHLFRKQVYHGCESHRWL